ncbi:3-dehydroquinate dehydratase [Spirosomataceae bacterium TFI 002]|nr:3-dehydroquinate dehydratase [Spirosomataceae bacterium TFI 002]
MAAKKLLIINGPNLNLLGKREPEIYGTATFEDIFGDLIKDNPNVELSYFQSNHEGALIDKIHEVGFSIDGVIINAGALTHTSIAIADAIAGVQSPFVEVHISNIHARERFRHHSYLSRVCKGMICGLGIKGYQMAIDYFK